MIPEGNTLDDIKRRTQIIRDFYWEWKVKNPSQRKTKPGNKNQQPFERMLIMEYELVGIGTVKMIVGVRRRTQGKVQYCITAITNK